MRYAAPLGIVLLFVLFSTIPIRGQNIWRPTAGTFGGQTNGLARGASGTLIAATYANGLFRSTDNGLNWSRVAANINSSWSAGGAPNGTLYFGYVGVWRSTDDGLNWTIGNANSGVVWGIGCDADSRAFAASDSGVFRSTDNGVTWARVVNSRFRFSSIAVNASGVVFAAGDSGIYRSSDHGLTWMQANNGFASHVMRAVTVDPVSGTLYAGYYQTYKSTDNGNTWNALGYSAPGVLSLYVHPATGNLFSGTMSLGLWRSTDQGATWTKLTGQDPLKFITAITQCANGDLAAGSASGFQHSTDGGNSWSLSVKGLAATLNYSLIATPTRVITGTASNGAFVTTDGGMNWTMRQDSIYSDGMTSIAYKPSNGYFFAGSYYGIYRSTDAGTSWRFLREGPQYSAASMATHPNGDIYAGLSDHGVVRSSDNGLHWERRWSPLADSNISCLAISNAAVSAGYIYAGTEYAGAYRSTDQGASWVAINNGLSQPIVNDMAVSPVTGDVYLSSDDGTYRSTDKGASWTKMFPDQTFYLAVHRSGQIFRTGNSDVWHSTDRGATWNPFSSGLPGRQIYSIAIDSSDHVYVGAEGEGIYTTNITVPVELASFTASQEDGHALLRWSTASESRNAGFEVQKLADGCGWRTISFVPGAGTSASAKHYSYRDPTILTGGASYRLRQVDYDGTASISEEIALSAGANAFPLITEITPHPARGETRIAITLDDAGCARIVLNDLSGREGLVLLDEYRDAGRYSVGFNADLLAPGCYILSAATPSRIAYRALIVR